LIIFFPEDWSCRRIEVEIHRLQQVKVKEIHVEQWSQGNSRSRPPRMDLGKLEKLQQQQSRRARAYGVVGVTRGSQREESVPSWDR